MTDALDDRLAAIASDLPDASDDVRADLLDHLEEIALTLQAQGRPLPAWVREALLARDMDAVEDGFDNMPV